MKKPIEELQLVGIRQAAQTLGISETTLRQWICYGRFPFVKVGRRTLISVSDLADFIAENRVPVRGGE